MRIADLCPTCDTSINRVGVGKAAKEVAVHSCTMGGTANASCCD